MNTLKLSPSPFHITTTSSTSRLTLQQTHSLTTMASPRHIDRRNASIFMPQMGHHNNRSSVILAALQADMEKFQAYNEAWPKRGELEEARKKSILAMAERGDGDAIIRVLNSNPSLIKRATNSAKETVLHVAARHGKEETMRKLVRFLVRKKPLISLTDVNKEGDTPLHLALKLPHIGLASYLISKTPDAAYIINNDGVSPLYLAVKGRHGQLVKELFEVLPGKSVSDSKIRRLLDNKNKKFSVAHAAVSNNDLGVLKMLLENLEIFNMSTDENGRKPISYAAYKGRHEQVSYFLEKFLKYAHRRDQDGSYPIHKAAMGGCVDTLAMFISSCPDSILWKGHTHKTLLHFAALAKKTKIIEFIQTRHGEKYKEIANAKDGDGYTYEYYLNRHVKSYLMKHGLASKL